MRRIWTRNVLLSALMAVAITAGCDLRSDRAEAPMGPETASQERSPFRWGRRIADPPADTIVPPDTIVPTDTIPPPIDPPDTGTELTLIEEALAPDAAMSTSRMLGLLGGLLEVGGHSIRVPLGAVKGLTDFSMVRVPGAAIMLDLNATGIVGFLNRVAIHLFDVPVTLELSYAQATNVDDPGKLVIVRVLGDGTYELLPTELDPEKKVVRAKLDHFSLYAMASN